VFTTLISREFLQCVWNEANEDDIFGRSAQLSYYFLLALFPLLLFLTTLFGYLDGAGSNLRHKLVSYLASVMPAAALQLVMATIDSITNGAGGGKLSFGLLGALWAASSGMSALGQTLNSAYDVRETRAWWKVRLVSLTLTVALSVLIVSALLIVLYGGQIGRSVAAIVHEGPAFALMWRVLQWPIALIFVFITFAAIYRFAPNLSAKNRSARLASSEYRRRWLTPGVVVAVVLWLLVSLGLRLYLHFFNSYSATYGSLGALIVLMLWFYLTGAAIIFGGEINCELEGREQRNAAESGS
jgi:membrane protein